MKIAEGILTTDDGSTFDLKDYHFEQRKTLDEVFLEKMVEQRLADRLEKIKESSKWLTRKEDLMRIQRDFIEYKNELLKPLIKMKMLSREPFILVANATD